MRKQKSETKKTNKMKNTLKTLSVLAIGLASCVLVQATPITGNISFSGNAQLSPASAGTATEVTKWSGTVVEAGDGAFAGIATGTAATFTSTPWSFNTAIPMANFWQVGGFSFELLSSSIAFQLNAGKASFVDVTGVGIVTAAGYTATEGTWNFTTQNPGVGKKNPVFSFSAASAVPDGGATLALLGFALVGVEGLRRKLAK